MEKRRKSGTAHYFFLVYIIMRRESVMIGSALLAYRIETTVKTEI